MLQSTECAAYVLPDAEDVTRRAQDRETASNSARQGQLGAKRRRVAREPDDDSSKPAFREAGFRSNPGAPFQNLQRFIVSTQAHNGR